MPNVAGVTFPSDTQYPYTNVNVAGANALIDASQRPNGRVVVAGSVVMERVITDGCMALPFIPLL